NPASRTIYVGWSQREDDGFWTGETLNRGSGRLRRRISSQSSTATARDLRGMHNSRRGAILALLPMQAASPAQRNRDRKSTRLNSSHVKISYAVFCLKKKNKNKEHK